MQRETPRDDLRALSRCAYPKQYLHLRAELTEHSIGEEVKASAIATGAYPAEATK